MSNPAEVSCPEGVWTKVMSAKISGEIAMSDTSPRKYLYCRKDTGAAAPSGQTAEGAEPIFIQDIRESFGATVSSDVYIYPIGADGEVTIDA